MQNTPNGNDSDARMTRGLEIMQSKHISENEDGSFAVPSQTSSKIYEVRLIQSNWVCTCPDFEYRGVESCKHIYAVRLQIATKSYLKDEPKPKVFTADAIPCDRCGSIRVIHYGNYGQKQVLYCKDCRHKFRESTAIRTKFTPELITLTLDLYFSGLSLRKIARNVHDHFHVDLGATTIYNWIRKFVPLISEYVNTLSPQLSKTWQADELFVRMKGSPHTGKMEGLAFVWNVMDRDTRFLLASKVSEGRDISAALRAFREAIQNANGQLPEKVMTDSHKSYGIGMRWAFDEAGTKVQHVKDCGVNKGGHRTNNRIERLNGTLRERTKVQRGWKSYRTPLAEGKRIHYNFVKPHISLEGKTPAEKAGLQPKGWNELVQLAVQHRKKALVG